MHCFFLCYCFVIKYQVCEEQRWFSENDHGDSLFFSFLFFWHQNVPDFSKQLIVDMNVDT